MNITVYCGAALGNVPAYQQATIELGKWLAQHHHRLIYGGGKVGLMGLLADTVLSHGGEVIGVKLSWSILWRNGKQRCWHLLMLVLRYLVDREH